MSSRPRALVASAALARVILAVFALVVIAGFANLLFALFLLVTEGPSEALPSVVLGVALIAGAYLANMVITFAVTKRWSWLPTVAVGLTYVPKEPTNEA